VRQPGFGGHNCKLKRLCVSAEVLCCPAAVGVGILTAAEFVTKWGWGLTLWVLGMGLGDVGSERCNGGGCCCRRAAHVSTAAKDSLHVIFCLCAWRAALSG
jgi:hypothetical protein